jgi:hypothetical protein
MQPKITTEIKIIGDLGAWEVALVTGGTLRLAAHAYSLNNGQYVFVALAEGRPNYEIELAVIPEGLVSSITGG